MSHTKTGSNFWKAENRQAIDSYDDSVQQQNARGKVMSIFFVSRKAYTKYSVEKTYFSTNIFMKI